MSTITNWRLSDPEYTEFEPVTVQQAILRFRRLQRKGLHPWRYPECFIKCAAKLPAAEVEKFEAWIVNPTGEPSEGIRAIAEEKWESSPPPVPVNCTLVRPAPSSP